MPQSLIVPPDSATRSTSKTSENDANRPAKSQMVGSLLSAYDDHDDESDMDAEPAAAPEATADAGAVGAGEPWEPCPRWNPGVGPIGKICGSTADICR